MMDEKSVKESINKLWKELENLPLENHDILITRLGQINVLLQVLEQEDIMEVK